MRIDRDDPTTWPCLRPTIIAHDVGRSRDRSTAVVGGNGPFGIDLTAIIELHELPQGLYGSPRASALAAIDRQYHSDALIVADLSNDPTYAEVLYEAFGPRVIGLQISRYGEGMQPERRPVKQGSMLIYTIGRSYLLELFQGRLQAHLVKIVDGPMSRRAYEQLMRLETEFGESGTVYACPSGQHDDLGISCAMLAWAARHPHLSSWMGSAWAAQRPRRPKQTYGWGAFT